MIRALEKQFINCEGKTVNFAGNTFPGRKSLKYLTKLIRIKSSILSNVGFKLESSSETPTIGGFIGTQSKSLKDLDIGKLVKGIGENLDSDELYNLIVEMLSNCKINEHDLGNDMSFDNIFSGDLPLLLEVLTYILTENYGNLFKKKLYSNLGSILGISL